jgi:pectate lyase
MFKRRFYFYLIAAVIGLAAVFSSCETVTIGIRAEAETRPEKEQKPIPTIRNNTTVRLGRGYYRGGTIASNKVTLIGRGTGATVIRGNLIITGNNCVVRGLTVDGNVVIRGNNANLTRARILGRVDSSGNNNVW